MKKILLSLTAVLTALSMQAQPPADSTPTYPQGGTSMAQTHRAGSKSPAGAAYLLSDGSTVTKTSESLSTSTSDYNVVQVTKGTLNLKTCTMTKTGDYSSSYSGDDTSFYGTNSAVYASGSSAFINMTGGTVTTNVKGANAVFATDGATITVSDVTINNTKSVSRGLHCTGGGIINAKNTTVTLESEAVWNLTGNSYVSTLVNNGTINQNGYTLTVGSSSGSGTINETTGIVEIESSPQAKLEAKLKVQDEIYTLDGRRADGTQKGLLIKKGKKYIAR